MKHRPYWWEHAFRHTQPVQTQLVQALPKKLDVAVVGAGYTGLSAALVLARAGVSVVVFEKGQLGEGASSRNGGMVGPSFHKLGVAGLKEQYGPTKTNEIIRESVGFVDFLESFMREENINADFAKVGRFRGAIKQSHYDAMARELDLLQEACGVNGAMVPHQEQGGETGSKGFCGGVVYHNDGGLHPAKLHEALVQKVRAAGAIIVPHTPVEAVEKNQSSFKIRTAQGDVYAEHLAICTNGYTGSQFAHFRRRVLPIRSAMISSQPLDAELLAELMPKARVYGDSRRIVAYYRPSPDGTRILFGSRASGLKDNPARNAQQLRHAMTRIFPQLQNVGVSHVWSGLVAYSFDHAPHIGSHDGLHYALGYCGSGVARANYFGQKLGYKILGETENGHTSFDDLPFQTKPFYSGDPWFMPMILNWHRMVDALGL